jgi:phenylacetate-CoA ligase
MRGLAWRLLEGRRNPGWRERLAEIRMRSRGPREALVAWQGQAVAAHLEWARAHIPFWRARLRGDTRLTDVHPLTRTDLQTSLDALVDERRPKSELRPDASGGSTGQPVRVVHDRDYWTWTFATEAWLAERWGLEPWARTAYLWGDDRSARPGFKERWRNRLLDRLTLNAFAMDEARMAAFAETLARFEPEVVQGYASALDLFAAFLLSQPRARAIRPKVVRSAAETLLPAQRERIEKAFGVPVRDVYGSREAAGLAAQCLHGGFHALEHGKVLEIVDDAGNPARPGAPGRVLVTDLTNRAMGLIRYENGDVAAWDTAREPCACGSPYARLARVLGRTSDFVTTPAGERIHGEWFTHLFYGRDDVVRFQVHQRALEAVDLLTVGSATEGSLAPLLARIRERLGPRVAVTWRSVTEIPASASGKHRFTKSDVPWASHAS